MRLLMTTDAVGGVWTYAMDLTRALVARGHEVTLAVMGPAPDEAQREEAAHVRLEARPYKLEWMQRPWQDVDEASAWLLDLERETQPHLVHLNGYAHAAFPWRAPVLVVAHSCVVTWWRAVHGGAPPAEYEEYRLRVARGLAAADLVVAPTRALLDEMRAAYGFATPSLVIPNGRDPRGHAVAPKEPTVLSVGRVWDEGKDIASLDAAARELPWPVEVIGEARHPDGEATRRLQHARPLGRLSDTALRAAYARAAIFAHPARYEAFGLAPLEAAISGCALVLSDIPTLREVWEDAALYAPPGDAAALHAALRALIDDPPRREALALAARQRAARYSADAMAAAYLQSYARLTKEVSPSAS